MRLFVQWPRLGPYHVARLRVSHALLAPKGVEVVAFETASDDRIYAWRREEEAQPFVRVQVFEGRSFNDIPAAEMMPAVTARLDALRPDAVAIHSYGYPDARATLVWCRRNRVPAILMTDSRAEDAPRVGWREWLKRRIVHQYDAALVAGTAARRYLRQLDFPDAAIFEGYDVVDNAFFADAARRAQATSPPALPGLEDRAPFLLASNRFIPRKDLDVLLLGYAAYRRTTPAPLRLVLLGDGPERPALEALVASHEIEGVTFAGFRQIDEIPAYYARAAALVHTARVDQWALVVNEAMACGLPVVVSEGTGCREDLVEDGGNGFVFRTGDTDDLARALHRLHTADLDALGARSRAIIAHWDLDRFAHALEDALHVARTRADRGLDPIVGLLMWALPRLSGSINAFQTVEP